MDFAGPIQGKMILVIIDSLTLTKVIELSVLSVGDTRGPCNRQRPMFCKWRVRNISVIKHVTSAPFHPATNRLAKRAMQIVRKEELWQVELQKY